MGMEIVETETRKTAIKALVGSHNYNLNTPESDRDYKHFVLPTFDDIYNSYYHSESHVGEQMDYTVHDIRKLPELLFKANINFVEVLFSKDFTEGYYCPEVAELVEMREEIARMNLPYLFSACKGMFFNKMKYIEKGTSGTIHLVEKHGYDTKQALHAYRVLDFLEKYCYNGFKSFGGAISYFGDDIKFMLFIKDGGYEREEFNTIINTKYASILNLEEIYKSKPIDDVTNMKVNRLVKELVKRNL